MDCAIPRSNKALRDCGAGEHASAKSGDASRVQLEQAAELKQALVFVQMAVKELNANINGLERKVDMGSDKMITLEQILLQMQQQAMFAKMEKGPRLEDIDTLLKKHMARDMGGAVNGAPAVASPQQFGPNHTNLDMLTRMEQGINHLLAMQGQPAIKEGESALSPRGHDHMRQEMKLTNAAKQHDRLFTGALVQPGGDREDSTNVDNGGHNAHVVQSHGVAQMTFREEFGEFKHSLQQDFEKHEQSLREQITLIQTELGRQPAGIEDFDGQGIDPPEKGQDLHLDCEVEKNDPEADHHEEKHAANAMVLRDSDSLASVFMCDDDPEAPIYLVEDLYYKTGVCQAIAKSNFFANFTVFVVVLNAIYLGIDSDWNDAQNVYHAHWFFQVCSQLFCVYFTWELVVRFLAFEYKSSCCKDGWFKFDAFLVSTMILDTWVLMPVLAAIGGGVKIPTQPLRMLRLFKLTRMARLMKSFPELVTMIKGLIRSLRAISSSMILVGLMTYTWAILMHMMMKEDEEYNKAMFKELETDFSTISYCMWSLILCGTLLLDGAGFVMTTLVFAKKVNRMLAGWSFVMFTLLSAMLILQMLIGVLCDVVSRVGQEQRDATAIGLVKQELLELMETFDDGDGHVSSEELKTVMNNPVAKALMKKLNINRLFLMELQKTMFGSTTRQISIKNTLELMLMCRGDNVATVEALAGGLLSVHAELEDIKNMIPKPRRPALTKPNGAGENAGAGT